MRASTLFYIPALLINDAMPGPRIGNSRCCIRPCLAIPPIKSHNPKPKWNGRKAKSKRGRSPAWKVAKREMEVKA